MGRKLSIVAEFPDRPPIALTGIAGTRSGTSRASAR